VLCWAVAAEAQGSASLERGVAAYERGELEEASDAFDAALAEGGLSREDFVRLLAHRALLAHANQDQTALEVAALRLVTLDPDALGRQAPPAVQQVLDAARADVPEILGLELEHEAEDDGVRVRLRVRNDAAGLVEGVRLQARVSGGEWQQSETTTLRVEGATAADVEVVARAVGPAGTILAELGSDEPARLYVPAAEVAAAATLEEPAAEGGSGVAIGVGVTAALVVVAVAVVLAVVLRGDDDSNVAPAVVEF